MAGTVIKIAEHDKDQETAEMTTDGEHTAMILIVVRLCALQRQGQQSHTNAGLTNAVIAPICIASVYCTATWSRR